MVLLKMKQRPDADCARSMIFPESQSITDDESPGKRLQVLKFQNTNTNSDIQNSDMIGAKMQQQQKKKTHTHNAS